MSSSLESKPFELDHGVIDRSAVIGFPRQLSDEVSLHRKLSSVENQIGREFSQRIHRFHIEAINHGLVLEGFTRTYFSKQAVQEAVVKAINLPIMANNICVERLGEIFMIEDEAESDPSDLDQAEFGV
jgi:hypothetical protein